jgi:hypothetical protein
MSVSQANVGQLYQQNYNGIHWTQPGGQGTTVYPQEAIGTPFTNYPVPGQIFSENAGALWVSGCGHWFDCVRLQQDYDATTGSSCCCVLCPICSYIINLIEPFEDAIIDVAMTTKYPIVIP